MTPQGGICDSDPVWYADSVIFILPEGYRPTKKESQVTISNNEVSRVNVTDNGLVRLEGAPNFISNAKQWISLGGFTFRVAN